MNKDRRTEKDIELVGQDTLNPFFRKKEDGLATECQHPLPISAPSDDSASPWRWVRRLLPLVAMGVGVGLQPGSLVIFSGAAALDPHSAIIFLGLLSVSAMTVSRWPYLFLIAIAVALVGISATVQPVPESKRELELYIRHCRRLTKANCLN